MQMYGNRRKNVCRFDPGCFVTFETIAMTCIECSLIDGLVVKPARVTFTQCLLPGFIQRMQI